MSSNWITEAEAALRATAPSADLEVIRAEPSPVFDAEGVRAILAPFFAAFLWAATIFRELQSGAPLDPLALLLRLLALALSVRAVLALWRVGRRLQLRLGHQRYALVLTPEGLLYRTPDMDIAVPREDIVDVRERGRWKDRGGRRFADVYVVTHARSGRTHIALPPVFERTPGVLAERLMRWLGPRERIDLGDVADAAPAADAQPVASELWERVASGERPPGVIAIPHGSTWLQRGPYASVLLGVAVLWEFVRLPEATRRMANTTLPLSLVATLVFVLIAWLLLTRAQLKPRRGLAAILTPSQLLLRTRAGVLRVPWPEVQRVDIESRAAWSLLLGAHEARSLTIHRRRSPQLSYHESFVGVPLEVLGALCDAYRKSTTSPSSGADE